MIEKIKFRTEIIHGYETEIEIIDLHTIVEKVDEIIDFLNKKFPDNDIKIGPSDILSTGQFSYLQDNIPDGVCDNNVHEPISLRGNAACPHCGASYYTEIYTTTTAMSCPPTYKNGVNINPHTNQSTTHCKCNNCGKEFNIK